MKTPTITIPNFNELSIESLESRIKEDILKFKSKYRIPDFIHNINLNINNDKYTSFKNQYIDWKSKKDKFDDEDKKKKKEKEKKNNVGPSITNDLLIKHVADTNNYVTFKMEQEKIEKERVEKEKEEKARIEELEKKKKQEDLELQEKLAKEKTSNDGLKPEVSNDNKNLTQVVQNKEQFCKTFKRDVDKLKDRDILYNDSDDSEAHNEINMTECFLETDAIIGSNTKDNIKDNDQQINSFSSSNNNKENAKNKDLDIKLNNDNKEKEKENIKNKIKAEKIGVYNQSSNLNTEDAQMLNKNSVKRKRQLADKVENPENPGKQKLESQYKEDENSK